MRGSVPGSPAGPLRERGDARDDLLVRVENDGLVQERPTACLGKRPDDLRVVASLARELAGHAVRSDPAGAAAAPRDRVRRDLEPAVDRACERVESEIEADVEADRSGEVAREGQ